MENSAIDSAVLSTPYHESLKEVNVGSNLQRKNVNFIFRYYLRISTVAVLNCQTPVQERTLKMAQPIQDMPPPQGFPSTIRYQRYIPSRGPSGAILFSIITATTLYGFYELSFIKNEERYL